MKNIVVNSLGQIVTAEMNLGDLTVLIGPQASGKSIFLQLIKLTLDHQLIAKTIKQYGFNWNDSLRFLSLYFGEGMENIWTDGKTQVFIDNEMFDIKKIFKARKTQRQEEKLFLIPAQRVLTLRNGWPRPFMDYENGDPYVVKQFSESLRLLMEKGLGSGKGAIFPQEGRMNKQLRDALDESIFPSAELRLDTTSSRRRLILKVNGINLPFMVWSAGQREFVPLLLGLYALMPSSRTTKSKDIDWVVIEEPEMGLHPEAITDFLMVVLELIHRGYKVILSTHSPQVLELVWSIRMMKELGGKPDDLLSLFNIKKNAYLSDMAKGALQKEYNTYFFDRSKNTVTVKNISTLDPGSDDSTISDWGGLTEFSSKVSSIVAKIARGVETNNDI